MPKIFGYGEDALTLWALKNHISALLKHFKDKTASKDCLVFYRPSFGRRGGKSSAEFGEFDAIVASMENIYLIESKWDNLSKSENDKMTFRGEQEARHIIFSWYIINWNKRYHDHWEDFVEEKTADFKEDLRNEKKKIPSENTTLAANLQFVLTMLQKHCPSATSGQHIKNVLLFFYNKKLGSKPPTNISKSFKLVKMDYSKDSSKEEGNFINLG